MRKMPAKGSVIRVAGPVVEAKDMISMIMHKMRSRCFLLFISYKLYRIYYIQPTYINCVIQTMLYKLYYIDYISSTYTNHII